MLTRVARTHNEELFLLVALAIGLGAAAVTQAVGLSLALGAFLAGLLISESDYAHETLARLLPLRDAFVALFFVTIGALIDPRAVFSNLPLLGAIVALVVLGKLVVWTLVVWARVRERFGVTVVTMARRDGSTVIDPGAETILRSGDRVRAFGLPAHLDAFRRAAESG